MVILHIIYYLYHNLFIELLYILLGYEGTKRQLVMYKKPKCYKIRYEPSQIINAMRSINYLLY